jgi:hypothetical protein
MESEQHLLNLSTLDLIRMIQGLKDDLEMYQEYLDREKNRSELLDSKIKKLEKEKLDTYHNGYQQGAFDEKMSWINQGHEEETLFINPQNLTSICLKCGIDLGKCICK